MNKAVCNTRSTWKVKRLLSSRIIVATRSMVSGVFVTAPSFNICDAKEIVAIGVLNSCVILLIKSFLITDNFFCRTITIKQNTAQNTIAIVISTPGRTIHTEPAVSDDASGNFRYRIADELSPGNIFRLSVTSSET